MFGMLNAAVQITEGFQIPYNHNPYGVGILIGSVGILIGSNITQNLTHKLKLSNSRQIWMKRQEWMVIEVDLVVDPLLWHFFILLSFKSVLDYLQESESYFHQVIWFHSLVSCGLAVSTMHHSSAELGMDKRRSRWKWKFCPWFWFFFTFLWCSFLYIFLCLYVCFMHI